MTEIKGRDESEFEFYRSYELESWFSNTSNPISDFNTSKLNIKINNKKFSLCLLALQKSLSLLDINSTLLKYGQ